MTTIHGGQRKGAGRPFGEYPMRLLKVAASAEELAEILAHLNTRQRTEALLDEAAMMRLRGEDDDRNARHEQRNI